MGIAGEMAAEISAGPGVFKCIFWIFFIALRKMILSKHLKIED